MILKDNAPKVADQCDSVPSSSEGEEEVMNFTADSSDRVYWPPRESTAFVAPWCRRRYALSLRGNPQHLTANSFRKLLEMNYKVIARRIVGSVCMVETIPLEKALRLRVFERVRGVLQRIWPTAKIDVFGSLYTNLFLPTSDIDVVVESNLVSEEPPLWKTAVALKESGITESINVLDKAFVPIVKMVDKDTKIYLDISFNTIQGVRSAKFIEDMKMRYPVLEPLVLVLKQFLMQRQLNQVFTGGLSSYGLILMLISFLQLHPSYDYSYKGITEVNMGVLLLNFLQLYGQEFNYMKTALRIHSGGAYVCKDEILIQMNRPSNSMLCIEDPLQPGNDIGRCSHNIQLVRQAFEHAFATLCAVFVRSREYSALWRTRYHGSLLSLILHISLE
ncbi:PAP-associated domain-containing protein 5 [Dirofilaria immitis]|nr:PAP-associated domain-containing protein 5 [Dirofilaria immitis]